MYHPRIIYYEHVIANVATQIHRINSTERAMFVLFPEHYFIIAAEEHELPQACFKIRFLKTELCP